MKKSTIGILIGLGVLILWAITARNGMATAKVGLDGKWGEVENQYQRRLKLYTNVIQTIKGAANFEKKTLENIVRLRAGIPDNIPANDAEALQTAQKNAAQLTSALRITVEAYPNLTATQGFRDFQAQIEGTENRVATAIGRWNEEVTNYNVKIIKFPGNLLAGLFGYTSIKNYKAQEGAKEMDVKADDFKFE
jgi:LemA protein